MKSTKPKPWENESHDDQSDVHMTFSKGENVMSATQVPLQKEAISVDQKTGNVQSGEKT